MSSHTTPTTMAHRRGRASPRPEVRVGVFGNGIAYDAIGSGPRTLIFLPGGPGIVPMAWKRISRTLLGPLAAGGCTVWRLTRRRNMPAGHSLADMADDVAQVIDEAFGGHVDAVVGLSMGGMIAQFLAARHPDAIGRVVLLSAAAVPTAMTVESTRREGEAWGHGRYTEAGAAFFEDVLPGNRLRVVRRVLGVPMGRMLARSGTNPADVLVETAAVMDVDARPVLSRITAPVLLIFGDKDTSFAPDIVEETARLIPDCALIRYADRGHGGAAWDKRTPAHILDFINAGQEGRAVGVPTTSAGSPAAGQRFAPRIVEVVPGIHLIPSRMVNCYLIVEPDGVTLIDAGMATTNVLKYLAGLGRVPGDLNRIIITHSDPDHVGALADLKAACGARVYASAIEAESIAAARSSRPLSSAFARLVLKAFLSIVRQKPAQVDEVLSGGEELPIAGGLRVIATPGHTPGHISLFIPSTGLLFCGDSMEAGSDGLLRRAATARTWDEEKARESVEVQRMLGAEIVCPGHGPVVRRAASKFPRE